MAKPKWHLALQAKLDNCPLFYVGDRILCVKCKGDAKGKKLTLRMVVNYNHKTCAGCNLSHH